MASFLHANLPSEDEEDDSYNPVLDKTCEAVDRTGYQPKQKSENTVRRRGLPSSDTNYAAVPTVSATELKRKRTAANAFAALKEKSDSRNVRSTTVRPHGANAPSARAHPARPALAFPSAAPQNPNKTKQFDPDLMWMRSLGFAPPAKKVKASQKQELVQAVLKASSTSYSSALLSPAAAAPVDVSKALCRQDTELSTLHAPEPVTSQPFEPPVDNGVTAPAVDYEAIAAKALASVGDGLGAVKGPVVTITETRRFAGKEVEMTRELQAGSKAAEAALAKQAGPATGLDAMLQSIQGPKKANVMDKTRNDWSGLKATDQGLAAELETYSKSNDKYLDKQAFLKQADYNEYTKERDARLGSDIRSRGRL